MVDKRGVMKRMYRDVEYKKEPCGYSILLDNRPLNTPKVIEWKGTSNFEGLLSIAKLLVRIFKGEHIMHANCPVLRRFLFMG